MSAAEFNDWQRYFNLFPFGDERADWRMGMIVAASVNPNRKRGTPAASPQDFMMKPPQTQKQKEAGLREALKTAGRRKARQGKGD